MLHGERIQNSLSLSRSSQFVIDTSAAKKGIELGRHARQLARFLRVREFMVFPLQLRE